MGLKLREDYEPRFKKNPKTGEWEHINKAPTDAEIVSFKKRLMFTNKSIFRMPEDTTERIPKERQNRVQEMGKEYSKIVVLADKLTKMLNSLRGLFH